MPPPAENPMMPTRAGSIRQAAAFRRARRSACCASAIPMCSTSRSAGSSGSGLALPLRISSSFRGPAPAPPTPGGGTTPRPLAGIVCSVRYFSTSAAMPLLFNHCATLTPSLSQPRSRSAPPGATTTAVPVALAAAGRNTVTVGSLTLVIVRSPVGEVVVASGTVQRSEPGALPGQRRISCGACATASLAIASTPIRDHDAEQHGSPTVPGD